MEGGKLPSRVCSASEIRFVLLVGVIALALSSVPYVLGAALATEERSFGGFVYAVEDCYSYLAKMRQGAEGAWLFHTPYTSEPHMGTLFYLFYLWLGKLAALPLGGDLAGRLVAVYHAARVVLGLALLLTVYRFLAAFTERVAMRRLAWLMVTFGGGLGWLLIALGQPDWLGDTPLDLILPEGFTFLVLYAFPHLVLGRTFMLCGFLFLLRAWGLSPSPGVAGRDRASRTVRDGLLAGLAWLLMGLIVPFYVAVAWAVMGSAWLMLGLRSRRVAWQELPGALAAALVSAPAPAYSAWVFTIDPVYAAWASQNMITSPHALHYLAAYGVLFLLAAFALRETWRAPGPLWLAWVWVAVTPVLVYLPFNAQRRLVEGVQVALSLLAAFGLTRVLGWATRVLRVRPGLALVVVLVTLSLTNVLLVAGNSLLLRGRPAPIYRDASETAALEWLDSRLSPDDVVLASYETANYLPVRAVARVFVGHGPETMRFDEKMALMRRFYGAESDDTWRRGLLEEYGVDYVFWGPAERAVGSFDPASARYLREAYDEAGYLVFEVAP